MSDFEDRSKKKITNELFKLEPDALIELYEIDFSTLQRDFEVLRIEYGIDAGISNEPVYRFTSSINGTNPIFWQGNAYQPLPIQVTEFELPSDGRLPRPKIKMASPSGMLSAVVAVNHDFHGCKVTRKRTFAKFLDDVNFFNRGNPFGQSDFEAHLPDDVYYIHRKTFDSKEGIEFELASILEISDIKFPGRQIMEDYCPFRYRDESCGYKGVPVCGVEDNPLSAYGIYKLTYIDSSAQRLALTQDKNGVIPEISEWNAGFLYQKGDVVYLHGDKPPISRSYFVCIKESSSEYLRSTYPATSQEHWVLDSCSKKLTGCLKRFGSKCANKLPLPFGGFPSVQGLKYD